MTKRSGERYTPPIYAVLVKRAKLKADADSIKNEGTIENCCVKLADAVPSIEEFLRAYRSGHDFHSSIYSQSCTSLSQTRHPADEQVRSRPRPREQH